MFFGRGRRSKAKIKCPLCEQLNDEGLSDCLRCGYKLGKDGSQQQGGYVEQQANDLFSALMEDDEEEDIEGPMVDWSQTTFTMDDVTIEVSQYNDEGDVSLSSTPKFASQFEDMPEDAKNILPSKIDSEKRENNAVDARQLEPEGEDGLLDTEPIEDETVLGEEVGVTSSEVDDPPLAEVESEEPLDDDLPLAEAVADEVDFAPAQSEKLEKGKINHLTKVPLNVEPDPIPNMDEEELFSLTNAELRSMLASLGASTDGNKKELVERFLDAKVPHGEAMTADVDEGSTIESLTDTDIRFDSSQTLEGSDVQPRTSPPIIPDINLIPDSAMESESEREEGSIMKTVDGFLNHDIERAQRPSYWPWAQQMPWIERDIAVKLKQAMGEAKEKRMGRARELLDEAGPHLGERTRLLFPVCRLLQALGRGDEVPKIIDGAEKLHPSDPAVADARYRLGV